MQSLSLFNPLPAFCMEAEVSPGKYGTQAHWSAKQLYQDAVDKKRKLDVPKKTRSCPSQKSGGGCLQTPKLKD